MHDRYRAAGLVGNPFAVQVHDGDVDLAGPDWFVDRGLPEPPPAGRAVLVQVIGEPGAGKTTHLVHWGRRRPAPHHYVPRRPYRQRWRVPPVAPLVYADEVDRMPVPLRRWWFGALARRGATVVVGTHTDLSRLGRRVGLSVRTHRLGPASAQELAEVVRRRLEAAALPGRRPAVTFDAADLRAVLAASGGNLRAADGALHRLLAQRLT